jgi:acetoin:2,6-dichlorophenolindophenol oxidoreductase subunit alpha
MDQDGESLIAKLERMLLIRRFEEGMLELHKRGIMPVHFHVSIGQEATAVAVCSAARSEDVIYTNHRGADPGRMYAEQLGRMDGNTRGKGGTLHMIAPELGVPWTTSLVGCVVPMAVGSGLALRHFRKPGVVIAFFGDGLLEEGAFYEGVNLAALWQAPVVFVCENNAVAPASRASEALASPTFLARRALDVPAAFGLPAVAVDGSDAARMFELIEQVVGTVRESRKPYFVEVRTSRYPGNETFWPHLAGIATSMSWVWDSASVPDVLATWVDNDPLILFARMLLQKKVLDQRHLLQLDGRVLKRIEDALEFASNSSEPPPEEAFFGARPGGEL